MKNKYQRMMSVMRQILKKMHVPLFLHSKSKHTFSVHQHILMLVLLGDVNVAAVGLQVNGFRVTIHIYDGQHHNSNVFYTTVCETCRVQAYSTRMFCRQKKKHSTNAPLSTLNVIISGSGSFSRTHERLRW